MKAEALKLIPEQTLPDVAGRLATGEAFNQRVPEGIFSHVEPAEHLEVPNYLDPDGECPVVPSLRVVTPLGHEARMIDLHESDKNLEGFYADTLRGARHGMPDRLTKMAFDGVVRILDTNGAEGMHHLHKTRFPYTIYFSTKRANNGITPNVYVTQIGSLSGNQSERTLVYAMLTATRDAGAQYDLFKTVGSTERRRR